MVEGDVVIERGPVIAPGGTCEMPLAERPSNIGEVLRAFGRGGQRRGHRGPLASLSIISDLRRTEPR